MPKKTVLITAGNRGLGRCLVKSFATKNWQVLATARNKDTLPNECEAYELDLASPQSVEAFVVQLKEKTIDLIIHNAGFNPKDIKTEGYFESTFYAKSFSATAVAESLQINALHPMELTGKLLAQLSSDAAVVAISSWLGSLEKKNVPGHYGYSGSKCLMNMFMRGLAMEFHSTGQAAVVLNPGWMKTDMGGSNASTTPESVAEAIVTMAEKQGYWKRHNGTFLNVDGSEHPW